MCRAAAQREPHAVLGAAVALVLAEEYLRRTIGIVPWFPLQVATAALALALCWRGRDRLRLGPLLAVALLFHVGWLLVRLHAAFKGFEPAVVYAPTGQSLLDGHYPHSEYPVGAVLLFAFEALLGGAHTHLVHAFLMVPFQLATVAALWGLRTRWSPWFAAVVAFWPVNAWFWEWHFEPVPALLLALGLLLASRERWVLAGCVLAAGFTVKWTPGLALLPLAGYLLARRHGREAMQLAAAGIATAVLVDLPFVLWSPSGVLAAYRRQGGRSINDESLWHLPLRALNLEGRHGYARPTFASVAPPGWANGLAIVVQILALAALVWLSTRALRLDGAVALAALMPVVFLVTNRVFSVQYFALFVVAWAASAALVVDSGRQAVLVTAAAAAATVANAFISPVPVQHPHVWELMSLARFTLALGLTGWLAVTAASWPRTLVPSRRPASA